MKKMQLNLKRFFSIILTMSLVLNLMGNANLEAYAANNKVETAINWAIGIANDNSHGYSQSVRWGPHYDCSSFVYSAFYQAGFNLPGSGTRYTQTMVNHFTKAGFIWIPWSQIGSMNNLQRGDILLNNSSNSSKQHTEIYLGNGQNVGAHSPSKGISVSGYYNHPWLGVLRYGSASVPTNPQISKNQYWYDLQDRIEITAHADGATSYFMSMFKDENKIISQGVDGGKFSLDAKTYGQGDYSVYFSCTNSAGTVDTKWIDFSVVGEPAYSDVRVSDYWYDLSDTVSITVDTICAKGQVIGIDKNGVERVVTESTDSTYEIEASKLGVGKYSAYFSVYNGSGTVDTKRVEFEIVNEPKEEAVVSPSEVINMGEDFSGFIMNSGYWKPIMQDSKGNVVLGTENSQDMAQQLWHFVRNPQNGYYTIESYYNGKVLSVEDSKDEDGANVICSEKDGSASQQWFVLSRPDGSRYLKAACSERNLDLSSDSKADGANIQMWPNNNTNAQTFSIYQLDGDRDKISYDLISNSASIGIGEKTRITVSNAFYAVDYKLHVVSPNGKNDTINLGTRNTYDFSADEKGIYKVYASVKSPVSSYSGSVDEKYITIAVDYDYETSAELSTVFQGHLYQLVKKKNINWVQARDYCESKNSYLAAITSEEENREVAKLVEKNGSDAFIGGIRRDADSFRWSIASGEDFTYSNWQMGEPNYHDHGTCQIRDPYGEYAKENYIGMYTNGTWNDYMVISSSVNAFVMESAVTSLQVSTPIKTDYKVGDEFDRNSIVVEAEFSDGSKTKVTDYTISRFDSSKDGVQKVTITYFDVSQSIDVKVESITVEKEHDYQLSDTKKATCTKDGYHKYICSNCSNSYTESIPATGHTWNIGKVTLEATALTDGILTYTCISCEQTKTESIPATGQPEDDNPDDKDTSDNKEDPDDQDASDHEDNRDDKDTSDNKDNSDDQENTDKNQTDIDEGKDPDKDKTDIDDEENSYEETDPDKDDPGSDEDDSDSEENDSLDIDDGQESSVLEVGDLIVDAESDAEYEILSIKGNVICAEYMESGKPKATTIIIPATIRTDDGTVCKVTSVSKCAFRNNGILKKVVIGNNVTTIGTKAFSGCKNLTSITMGKNVVAIGANAFSNCTKLTSLAIPAKTAKIGSNAFSGCKKLKKLEIKSRKLNAKGVNKKAFKGIPVRVVIQVPKDRLTIYKKLLCQKGLSKKNKIK